MTDAADISDLIGDEPERALTRREAMFIAEYLVDFCYWKALMRSEDGQPDEKNWRQLAYQLMQRPHMRAAVQRALQERASRLNTTADEVLREITRLAMFDPAHITGVQGPDDIVHLPEDVRRAIVGWSWDRNGNFVVKMAKEGMLQLLAQHHGLIKQKIEHSGPNGGPIPVTPASISDEQLLAIASRATQAAANAAKP